MNAKRSDKIATGVLYAVAGIIVLILEIGRAHV